jgi:hypothetical protein
MTASDFEGVDASLCLFDNHAFANDHTARVATALPANS